MKKLLGIVVLGLLWTNISLANLPYTFFGIKLGDDIKNYKSSNCDPCADGKAHIFNYHNIISSKPHKDFIKYEVRTSAKSNKIISIRIKGNFTYDDWQGDVKTHLNTCRGEQNNLLNALKEKYESEYPNASIKNYSERISIISIEESDGISITLNCEPVDPEPEWKFYKKNGSIFSTNLMRMGREEGKDLGLEKTNTTGF